MMMMMMRVRVRGSDLESGLLQWTCITVLLMFPFLLAMVNSAVVFNTKHPGSGC